MAIPSDDFQCPYCLKHLCVRGRQHDDGTEWRCLSCGKGHTRKEGSDEAFLFFPSDVEGMVDPDIVPELNWGLESAGNSAG